MSKKLNVLMICTLPPPVHGSAMVSQYIKDSKLINDKFNMDFVNLSTSRKMEEIGKASLVLFLKKIGRFISDYISCFWLLLTNKYDLCYCAITCHGIGFLKDAPFVLLCKVFRRKVVIHQHNKGMSKCVDKWPYSWLIPLVYRNSKVMLLSWYLYDDISKVVSRDQILICPNGIPEITEHIEHIERNNAVPRLLFLSNLIESKGVYVLLDACKILKENGCQFVCDFVGGETKEITRAIFDEEVRKRGLVHEISYKGRKYGEAKQIEFSNADIFAFPTFYGNECFPLVLLEAMQYGLAIVTTDVGGIPDIIDNDVNGFIVKAESSYELAKKLEHLISNDDIRRRFAYNALKDYKTKFTLLSFEKTIIKCFNSVIINSL